MTRAASFRVRSSSGCDDDQRQHPPGERARHGPQARSRPVLVEDESGVDHDDPRPPSGRAWLRFQCGDPDVEVEPLDELPGVFGQRKLLPGEGAPLLGGLAVGLRVAALAPRRRPQGTATSMLKTGSRLSAGNALGAFSMSPTFSGSTGSMGSRSAISTICAAHPVHDGLIQVVV